DDGEQCIRTQQRDGQRGTDPDFRGASQEDAHRRRSGEPEEREAEERLEAPEGDHARVEGFLVHRAVLYVRIRGRPCCSSSTSGTRTPCSGPWRGARCATIGASRRSPARPTNTASCSSNSWRTKGSSRRTSRACRSRVWSRPCSTRLK